MDHAIVGFHNMCLIWENQGVTHTFFQVAVKLEIRGSGAGRLMRKSGAGKG